MSSSSPLCRVPSDWWSDPSQCWYDWQTMIGGLSAVAIGAATIWCLKMQIDQAKAASDRHARAQLEVARSKLPIASSAVAAHAKACIEELDAIEPYVTQQRQSSPKLDVPPFPPSAETTFDAFIAATDDEIGIFTISAIYAEQQVLSVRMEDMHSNPRAHRLAIDDYYLQPILMHALSLKLLAYGRRETDIVERVDWTDLQSSARLLLRLPVVRDRVLAKIAERSGRSASIQFALREMK